MNATDYVKRIKEIETLNNSTPNGTIQDADTILADVMDESDFEITGLSEQLFNLILSRLKEDEDKELQDKQVNLFEQMFELFTGITFSDYLDRCRLNITKKHHAERRR